VYLRFVVPARHAVSQEPTGLFSAVWDLEARGALTPWQAAWWRETVAWFGRTLPEPTSAARSRRPNAPNRAIFWFKASAREHIARMREVAALLEQHDVRAEVLQSARPGYVVYEDEFQVAAEPFRGALRDAGV
jgi:hypothetical protein